MTFGRFISSVHYIMALSKEKKSSILSDLTKVAKEFPAIVFVSFHKLPIVDSSLLRKGLREKEVGYTVAKKTLIRKAFEKSGVAGDMPALPGEIAIVYGKDSLAPAREIYEFQKKFDKRVSIVGGIFEGAFMDQEKMISIAQIPGMQTLRAQFVNLINSPIQRLVIGLNAIAEKKQ